MKKQKKLTLILALAFALLLLLYFCVVMPLVNKEEPPPPPLDVDEGEGLYHNIRLLYENIDRVDIESITLHNDTADYSFIRKDPEKKNSDFIIKEGENIYYLPEYDYEKISEIVVAAGTTYVREKIINGEVSEEVFAEYGLSLAENPAYFVLKTFDGRTEKVYIGEKTITDGGYYLRREGVDAVYVSQSVNIGDAVLRAPQYYVKPLLTAIFTTYGNYYTKDFTVWSKKTDENERVHRDDTVQFVYYELKEDGSTSEKMEGSADLRDMQVAIKDAFEGKRIGDGDFTFVRKYVDNYEDKNLAGRSVTYYVEKIIGIDRLEICLNYINTAERSLFSAGDIYAITDPRDKRSYTPNTDMYMTILDGIAAMEGAETVAIGVSAEKIAEYGLGAYKIYYETPQTIKTVANSNDVITSNHMTNMLYVSERQEDGTYFVGSLLFDIIAKVDAETLDYLSWPFSKWVSNKPFSININDIALTQFRFSYADANETHSFYPITNMLGEKNGIDRVLHEESGKNVSVNNYRQLFMVLLTTYFSGDYDGEREATEIISDKEGCILTLEIELKNGEGREWKFYPYTERKVLVSVDGGAYFYINSSEVEKLYNDIQLLLDGKALDYEKKY